MMWLCRAGRQSILHDEVIKNKEIILGWEGYKYDMHNITTIHDFREIVIKEKNPSASATISNRAGQLFSFCCEMKKGDYVLIPSQRSRFYSLAKITGDYKYVEGETYPHRREIKIIKEIIKKESLSQSTQYSIGAFRTIFKVKQEDEILKAAEQEE